MAIALKYIQPILFCYPAAIALFKRTAVIFPYSFIFQVRMFFAVFLAILRMLNTIFLSVFPIIFPVIGMPLTKII